jgi:hypothetical protein
LSVITAEENASASSPAKIVALDDNDDQNSGKEETDDLEGAESANAFASHERYGGYNRPYYGGYRGGYRGYNLKQN